VTKAFENLSVDTNKIKGACNAWYIFTSSRCNVDKLPFQILTFGFASQNLWLRKWGKRDWLTKNWKLQCKTTSAHVIKEYGSIYHCLWFGSTAGQFTLSS
jgi:hypothetical protein